MSFLGQHIRGSGNLTWIWSKKEQRGCENVCHPSQKLGWRLQLFILWCNSRAHGCLKVWGDHSHNSHHCRSHAHTPLGHCFANVFQTYGCLPSLKIKPLHYIVLLKVQNFLKFPNPILPRYFPLSVVWPQIPLIPVRRPSLLQLSLLISHLTWNFI